MEELADIHFEDLEDLEERLKADFVFPGLHAAEVRLLDSDPGGQLCLRQVAVLAQLPDPLSNEGKLLASDGEPGIQPFQAFPPGANPLTIGVASVIADRLELDNTSVTSYAATTKNS